MGRRNNGEGSYYFNAQREAWEYKLPYHDNFGIRHYKKFTGKTKKEIKKKVQIFKEECVKNADTVMTIKDWMEAWFNAYIVGHVKLRTEERYRLAIKRYINPFIGELPLDDSLTGMKVQIFLNTLYNNGGKDGGMLAARTVNAARMILNSALKRAVGERLIATNPVQLTKPIKADPPVIRPLTQPECQKLVNSAWQEPNKAMWIAVVIALETGFRKSEIFGLKWSDIDFSKNLISITETAVTGNHGIMVQASGKTKYSRRTVEVTQGCMKKIRLYQKWQKTFIHAMRIIDNYENYLITAETGRIKDPNDFTNVVFKRILARAGLDRKIRFHDLRHTHATQLLAAGVDIKTVSLRLGHASIRITLDTYVHVIPSMQNNAIIKLEALSLTN